MGVAAQPPIYIIFTQLPSQTPPLGNFTFSNGTNIAIGQLVPALITFIPDLYASSNATFKFQLADALVTYESAVFSSTLTVLPQDQPATWITDLTNITSATLNIPFPLQGHIEVVDKDSSNIIVKLQLFAAKIVFSSSTLSALINMANIVNNTCDPFQICTIQGIGSTNSPSTHPVNLALNSANILFIEADVIQPVLFTAYNSSLQNAVPLVLNFSVVSTSSYHNSSYHNSSYHNSSYHNSSYHNSSRHSGAERLTYSSLLIFASSIFYSSNYLIDHFFKSKKKIN